MRGPITRANEVWTADYKGEFLTGDHRYCYPLTVLPSRHSEDVLIYQFPLDLSWMSR
jgi:hypothetical protein